MLKLSEIVDIDRLISHLPGLLSECVKEQCYKCLLLFIFLPNALFLSLLLFSNIILSLCESFLISNKYV